METLYIGNDITEAEPVQIFCEENFVKLVDERLGRNASDYVRTIMEERDANYLRQELADQIDDLKTELDEARNELDDLRKSDDMLDAIRDILDGR